MPHHPSIVMRYLTRWGAKTMSEKNTEKAEKTEKKAGQEKTEKGAKAKGSEIVKGKETVKKTEKVRWTLQRCQKYARRFETEAAWAAGAPASYKSAVAHGWADQCRAELRGQKTKQPSFAPQRKAA